MIHKLFISFFFSFITLFIFSQPLPSSVTQPYGCLTNNNHTPTPTTTLPLTQHSNRNMFIDDSVLHIPLVFHILHNGEEAGQGQFLSPTQIYDQIDILNEDFSSSGLQHGGSGIGIRFFPAKADPQGCLLTEAGIHPINRNIAGFQAPPYSSTYIDGVIKPLTQWNPEKYLNIWICDIESNVAGYAQLPDLSGLAGIPSLNGPGYTDGIVLDYLRVGRDTTSNSPFNLGRTATHEMGHFMGLIHIWGDGGCEADDFCDDTPLSEAPYSGCPNSGFSCGTEDQIGNYMDFIDDACMFIFTEDQRTRIRTVMSVSPRRRELVSANPDISLPVADFSVNLLRSCGTPLISVVNQSTCPSSENINWVTPNATLIEQNDNLLTLQYNEPGIYQITQIVSNETGIDSLSMSVNLTNNQDLDTLFFEDFEGTLDQWKIENSDKREGWILALTNEPDWQKAAHIPLYDYPEVGERDALISPEINVANHDSLTLCFSFAYQPFDNAKRDSLIIRASTDRGITFPFLIYPSSPADINQFYQLPPSNTFFTPKTDADWCGGDGNFISGKCIPLQAYNGSESITFRIESYNDFGNNIYIDNFRIVGRCKENLISNISNDLTEKITLVNNPASGSVHIRHSNITPQDISIRISDISGKLFQVINEKIAQSSGMIEVELHHLPKGILFFQIFTKRKVTTLKLLSF